MNRDRARRTKTKAGRELARKLKENRGPNIGRLVTTLVKVVRWVVVWVGKWLTYVVCQIVTSVLNFLAVVVGLILSIPIIGRLIGLIWHGLIDLFWRIISLLDVLAGIFGLHLPKKA